MLRMLIFTFNGDIHWVFFYYKHESRQLDSPIFICGFVCKPIPFRFRKHKGHGFDYDVKK